MNCNVLGHHWEKRKSVKVVESDPLLIVFQRELRCKNCGISRNETKIKELQVGQKYRL